MAIHKSSKEGQKVSKWAKWVVKRPGMFFGVGLTIHLVFVVVTVALSQAGYNILPMVFDGLPLELKSDPMYLRTQAWYNRDEELDGEETSRRKRDLSRGREQYKNNININVDIQDPQQTLYMQGKILEALADPRKFSEFLDQKDNEEDIWEMSLMCCQPNDDINPFSRKSCSCKPYKHKFESDKDNDGRNLNKHRYGESLHRQKRDILDPENEPHERQYKAMDLTVIYQVEGNILTTENLRKIAAFEYAFYERKDYQTKYCRLSTIFNMLHCQNFFSILRFFDGSYSYAHDDLFDPSFVNVSHVLALAYQHEDLTDLLKHFMAKDSKIEPGTAVMESSMTRTTMTFGYPLAGYEDVPGTYSKNRNAIAQWAFDSFIPTFMEYFEGGLDGMKFYFYGQGLYWREVFKQILTDWYLLAGSVLFIYLFMWFQTGSLFITTFGIMSILTSFVGANLIYNVIIGYKFFGIFNILAIFIILGIGADDIFIYVDTWKSFLREDFGSIEQKMTATFKRAAIAMFVTSLTTMMAFFVNSFSPLLPVSAFGSFAGLTVLVNYISVVTFFPGVVMVYHYYFKKKACCCCCDTTEDDAVEVKQPKTQINDTATVNEPDEQPSNGVLPRVDKKEKNKHLNISERYNDAMCKFFGGRFFHFVTHRVVRWIILVMYVGLVVAASYLLSTITIAGDELQMFSNKHHLEVSKRHTMNSFLSNVEEEYEEITIAWGLSLHDMSMCPKLEYDNINPCEGKTVWDEYFDLTEADVQIALLNFCRDLHNIPESDRELLKLVKQDEGDEIICFIEDMAKFYETEGSRAQYPPGTSLALPITLQKVHTLMRSHPDIYANGSYIGITRPFEVALNFWLTQRYTNESLPERITRYNRFLGEMDMHGNNLATKIADEDLNQVFGEKQPEIYETKLRYAAMQVDTMISRRQLGLGGSSRYMVNWEEYIAPKISKLPGPLSNGWQFCWLWVWLTLIEDLVWQSVAACGIGIGLSFVVIFLGTTNILTGLFCTLLLTSVTVCVLAVIPLAGWQFGLLEALNLCLIIGLAVDYIVHIAEGYHMSVHQDRMGRLQDTLHKVGISVLSGAITTLGASFFMLFAEIFFFQEFGTFIFCTILFSMVFSLFVFIAAFSIFGPQGYTGSYLKLCKDRSKYEAQDEISEETNSTNGSSVMTNYKDGDEEAPRKANETHTNPAFEKETTDF